MVDINEVRIAAWNTDKLPIYEPGLLEVVKEARGRNLFFSTDVNKHVAEADIVFVRCAVVTVTHVVRDGSNQGLNNASPRCPARSVNTPTKTRGVGAGKAADLTYWEGAARVIASVSKSSKIIVEKSTVPVKTADAIEKVGGLCLGGRCFSLDALLLDFLQTAGLQMHAGAAPQLQQPCSPVRDLVQPRVLGGGHRH